MATANQIRRSVLISVFVMLAAGFIFYAFHPTQPSFHGRNLGEWLTDLENARDDQEAEPVARAVRHIGTNAIPVLLRMIDQEDSALKKKFLMLAQSQRFLKIRFTDATGQHVRAMLGFAALGPAAKSAVPNLEQFMSNTNKVRFAASA